MQKFSACGGLKENILLLAYRGCIPVFGVFPCLLPLIFRNFGDHFLPPISGTLGGKYFVAPIFRDTGAQMKKVVAPLMGGKIYPLLEVIPICFLEYNLQYQHAIR